jgi:hypothetical protein
MRRQVLTGTTALLATIGPVSFGCTNSNIMSGSGATAAPPAAVVETDPLTRAVRVASTGARAQSCGFSFDPAKVKAAYLSYESKQGTAAPQLRQIETRFDATLNKPSALGPSACSVEESAEIKRDLERFRAGFFNPRNKMGPDENFESKAFWKDQDDG